MPRVAGVIEGYLVEVKTGGDGKKTDDFLAAALLPGIVDIFYFVFFIVPDKQARLDFAVSKPGRHRDILIQFLRIAVAGGFRDMPVPAGLGIEALLFHGSISNIFG